MEYVRGRSLGRLVAEGKRLDLRQLIDCASQILAGLAVAHQRGVIHRDVKPGNVVLDENGAYKLVDFGLALGHDRDQGVTEENCVVGTVRYLAPEVATGHAAGPASDLFAAGLTLYESVTGTPAYPGDNTLEILQRVAKSSPPPISEPCPWIPTPLVTWFNRLLAVDTAERFRNAEDAPRRSLKLPTESIMILLALPNRSPARAPSTPARQPRLRQSTNVVQGYLRLPCRHAETTRQGWPGKQRQWACRGSHRRKAHNSSICSAAHSLRLCV